jgi:hypothetical protein
VRTRFSKFAAAVGLPAGLAVIGGSVIGGIALANDRSHGATTDAPDPAVSQATTDDDQEGELEPVAIHHDPIHDRPLADLGRRQYPRSM